MARHYFKLIDAAIQFFRNSHEMQCIWMPESIFLGNMKVCSKLFSTWHVSIKVARYKTSCSLINLHGACRDIECQELLSKWLKSCLWKVFFKRIEIILDNLIKLVFSVRNSHVHCKLLRSQNYSPVNDSHKVILSMFLLVMKAWVLSEGKHERQKQFNAKIEANPLRTHMMWCVRKMK